MPKEGKKIIKNSLFFVLLFIATYYFIFRKIDANQLKASLSNANYLFIFIAIILGGCYIILESFNHLRVLRLLNNEVSFKNCLKYSIIGFFFSGITPAATGGQPVQVYNMHKDGISIANGTLSILIQSFSYLTVNIILGILGYIFNYSYINELDFIGYFFFFGVIANGAIVLISLIAMFSRKTSHKILNFIVKIVKKFNEEKALNIKEKYDSQLDEYHNSAKFIISNRGLLLKTFLTNTLQLLCLHSIAYFVFLALGIKGLNYIKITFLQATLYLAVSILPLPGTVGVSETGFSLLYTPMIISEGIVGSAMLLTRGISFYLYMIITAVIVIALTVKGPSKKEKNITKK